MTPLQKTKEIIDLFSFLQFYVDNHVQQSFTDLTFSLEDVIKDVVNILESSSDQYININTIQHNYPAIDLVSKGKQSAIQVTTNADAKKVKETIKTYLRHGLQYKELIVIGFIKATKNPVKGAKVYGLKYLLNRIKYANPNQKDAIFEIVKKHIPWNTLSPLKDKDCFDVTMGVINRSAIRDDNGSEGSYEKMVMGLDEIKQIITTGNVKGKNIRAKAMYEYSTDVKDALQEIEFKVSKIISICNANKKKHKSILILDRRETDLIDSLKKEIISDTNDLAFKLGITKKIRKS